MYTIQRIILHIYITDKILYECTNNQITLAMINNVFLINSKDHEVEQGSKALSNIIHSKLILHSVAVESDQ